jgi:hypothetical protein
MRDPALRRLEMLIEEWTPARDLKSIVMESARASGDLQLVADRLQEAASDPKTATGRLKS